MALSPRPTKQQRPKVEAYRKLGYEVKRTENGHLVLSKKTSNGAVLQYLDANGKTAKTKSER